MLLLFGFETGYFRFRSKDNLDRDSAYSTALLFDLLVNLYAKIGGDVNEALY